MPVFSYGSERWDVEEKMFSDASEMKRLKKYRVKQNTLELGTQRSGRN